MGDLERLLQVIATLRSPEGCSWDRAQTLHSMRGYLVEETYEVLEAIGLSSDDPDRPALLTEELGVWLDVVAECVVRVGGGGGVLVVV